MTESELKKRWILSKINPILFYLPEGKGKKVEWNYKHPIFQYLLERPRWNLGSLEVEDFTIVADAVFIDSTAPYLNGSGNYEIVDGVYKKYFDGGGEDSKSIYWKIFHNPLKTEYLLAVATIYQDSQPLYSTFSNTVGMNGVFKKYGRSLYHTHGAEAADYFKNETGYIIELKSPIDHDLGPKKYELVDGSPYFDFQKNPTFFLGRVVFPGIKYWVYHTYDEPDDPTPEIIRENTTIDIRPSGYPRVWSNLDQETLMLKYNELVKKIYFVCEGIKIENTIIYPEE